MNSSIAGYIGLFCGMMMMIAFITINSGLVPLIEDLCTQILYMRLLMVCGPKM